MYKKAGKCLCVYLLAPEQKEARREHGECDGNGKEEFLSKGGDGHAECAVVEEQTVKPRKDMGDMEHGMIGRSIACVRGGETS